mmetsp:Transcript_13588/g.41932  ORF Transcript_13588/g.41932 Transcript_13588/m.41932 type:complete len:221 (+) Transcript_13588:1162-1824(+)
MSDAPLTARPLTPTKTSPALTIPASGDVGPTASARVPLISNSTSSGSRPTSTLKVLVSATLASVSRGMTASATGTSSVDDRDESDEVDQLDALDASGVTGNGPAASSPASASTATPSIPPAQPSSGRRGSPGTSPASPASARTASAPADEPQMPSRISGSEPPCRGSLRGTTTASACTTPSREAAPTAAAMPRRRVAALDFFDALNRQANRAGQKKPLVT